MSIDDALALLTEERPAQWLQYSDGLWAPVWVDGRVGSPITAEDLIEVARRDMDALEKAGFVTQVIDVTPLAVLDVEYGDAGQRTDLRAIECGPTGRR